MKEDKVADMVADMVADINIDMEIQFGDNFFDPKLTLGPKYVLCPFKCILLCGASVPGDNWILPYLAAFDSYSQYYSR